MNEHARLAALKDDKTLGTIARTFARAMEQMIDLEQVFAELAEKAPDELKAIRERKGAKPKAQALDAAMSTETKLPPPERFTLLSNVKEKQRTRSCTPAAMCAPDNRNESEGGGCRMM
jgi:hypothetical protein